MKPLIATLLALNTASFAWADSIYDNNRRETPRSENLRREPVRIDDVQNVPSENVRSNRKASLKTFEVSMGALIPASRAYPKKDAHYNFGLSYSWDVEVAFIEARVDYANRFSKPSQSYTSFTLGGNYVFDDYEVWSPYAGVNFGLGFTKVEGRDTKGGFHIGADLGALLLRDADVNLDIRFRLGFNTATIQESHPVFLGFLVGIRF